MRFLKRSVMLRLLIYSDILYLILRCWENGVLEHLPSSPVITSPAQLLVKSSKSITPKA